MFPLVLLEARLPKSFAALKHAWYLCKRLTIGVPVCQGLGLVLMAIFQRFQILQVLAWSFARRETKEIAVGSGLAIQSLQSPSLLPLPRWGSRTALVIPAGEPVSRTAVLQSDNRNGSLPIPRFVATGRTLRLDNPCHVACFRRHSPGNRCGKLH